MNLGPLSKKQSTPLEIDPVSGQSPMDRSEQLRKPVARKSVWIVGEDSDRARELSRALRDTDLDVTLSLNMPIETWFARLPVDEIIVLVAGDSLGTAAQVCVAISSQVPSSGLLVLCSGQSPRDAVECLRAGADDWTDDSYPMAEVVARLFALRRRLALGTKVLQVADLELDIDRRVAKRKSQTIPLTNREFVLLEFLMRRANAVVSRSEISSAVWNAPEDVGSNVIDVYISMLRRKVDRGFDKPLIRTIVGSGYFIGDAPTLS